MRTLLHFHKQFGQLHYDAIERIANLPESGIDIYDRRCLSALLALTGMNSPTEQIGGVICSDLEGPITPLDRSGNL